MAGLKKEGATQPILHTAHFVAAILDDKYLPTIRLPISTYSWSLLEVCGAVLSICDKAQSLYCFLATLLSLYSSSYANE